MKRAGTANAPTVSDKGRWIVALTTGHRPPLDASTGIGRMSRYAFPSGATDKVRLPVVWRVEPLAYLKFMGKLLGRRV